MSRTQRRILAAIAAADIAVAGAAAGIATRPASPTPQPATSTAAAVATTTPATGPASTTAPTTTPAPVTNAPTTTAATPAAAVTVAAEAGRNSYTLGERAAVTVTVTGDGRLQELTVDWGDGTVTGTDACSTIPATSRHTHRYRRSGAHVVTVAAGTGETCTSAAARQPAAAATVVAVAPTSEGPYTDESAGIWGVASATLGFRAALAAAVAGEPTELWVDVDDLDGGAISAVAVDFGNGETATLDVPCDAQHRSPTATSWTGWAVGTWTEPGTYQLTVTATSGTACGGAEPAQQVTGTVEIAVTAAASSIDNGPAQPYAQLAGRSALRVGDDDSQVRTVTIRWPDGAELRPHSFDGCGDGTATVETIDIDVPDGHELADAEVTVTSAGCDGTVQRWTGTPLPG